MRWGRKKPASSGSSSSGLSRALPVSWLSRFKGMSIAGSDSKPAKEKKQDETWQKMPASSSLSHTRHERDRYTCKRGDDFWRPPVGKENSTTRSEWYESVGELDFPATSFQTLGTNAARLTEMEPGKKFEEMMNKVQKKRREPHRVTEDFLDIDVWDREKGTVIMTPRLKFNKDEKKWVRNDQRLLEQKLQRTERKEKDTELKAAKSAGRTGSADGGRNSGFVGAGLKKQACVPSMNTGSDCRTTHDEDPVFLAQKLEKSNCQWQKLKETKLKEVKLKAEQQRKSLYIRRELGRLGTKQNSSVAVFSPRASSRSEKCRIRAIEDLKKAKLRTRGHDEKAAKGGIGKESFAVVKCSYDPQKDFRDSMIEMITENGINQPEELKELLVCYLTLNTDEYHDMIIKVFQEVWVDLKCHSYSAELQNKKGLRNSSF